MPSVIPSKEQELSLFRDRLEALLKIPTEDNRSRWFARTDRAADIACHWHSLLCVLLYREMRITGIGLRVSDVQGATSTQSLNKHPIDGGIIRCCQSLLTDSQVRACVLNYACVTATFRQRSGMRTANGAPPNQSDAKSPWPGHAGTSAMQLSHVSTGCFLRELNETLCSLVVGDFAIHGKKYLAPDPNTFPQEPTVMDTSTYGADRDIFSNMGYSVLRSLKPGAMLLDYLSNRMRSQGIFFYGLLSFAGLLHQDEGVALEAFDRLRTRAQTMSAITSESDLEPLPDHVQDDLRRLWRDDVYQELTTLILKCPSLYCCRRTYATWSQGLMSGTGQCVPTSSMEEPDEVKANSSGAEEDPVDFEVEGVPICTGHIPQPTPSPKTKPCPDGCTCEGSGGKLSSLLQDCFTGMYGTNWACERAFNAIRAVRKSQSVNTKGRAENTSVTKFAAQHGNSLKLASPNKGCPVTVNLSTWEKAPALKSQDFKDVRGHFENQQFESSKAFYLQAKECLNWNEPTRRSPEKKEPFFMLPAKNLLGSALVEELVCKVSKSLWKDGWKTGCAHAGTVLWSPSLKTFRVVLSVPSNHMLVTWPCQAVGGGAMVNSLLRFRLMPLQREDLTSLMIFPYIAKNPNETEPSEIAPEHKWYAVRTDPVAQKPRTTPHLGQLDFAVSRPRLNPPDLCVASATGVLSTNQDTAARPRAQLGVLPSLMDTVPIMEWFLEEGMPGVSLTTARKLLFEAQWSLYAEEPTDPDEPLEEAREKVLNRTRKLDFQETFKELYDVWGAEKGAEEKNKAFSRYALEEDLFSFSYARET